MLPQWASPEPDAPAEDGTAGGEGDAGATDAADGADAPVDPTAAAGGEPWPGTAAAPQASKEQAADTLPPQPPLLVVLENEQPVRVVVTLVAVET